MSAGHYKNLFCVWCNPTSPPWREDAFPTFKCLTTRAVAVSSRRRAAARRAIAALFNGKFARISWFTKSLYPSRIAHPVCLKCESRNTVRRRHQRALLLDISHNYHAQTLHQVCGSDYSRSHRVFVDHQHGEEMTLIFRRGFFDDMRGRVILHCRHRPANDSPINSVPDAFTCPVRRGFDRRYSRWLVAILDCPAVTNTGHPFGGRGLRITFSEIGVVRPVVVPAACALTFALVSAAHLKATHLHAVTHARSLDRASKTSRYRTAEAAISCR